MADHTEPTDTYGPAGTYGCACPCSDARTCIVLRYGEDADNEPCTCLCHDWRDEDDDL